MKAPLTWLLALATLTGCGSDSGNVPAGSTSVANGGAAQVSVAGVAVTVEPGVRFVARIVSTQGAGADASSQTTTIDGHPFGVSDGSFRIGPRDYGAVAAGDQVRVAPDGVFVNDQRRGALPPALGE
jgi:hypothetical protein